MPRRSRRSRRSQRHPRQNKGDDWAENMNGWLWKFFETIPVVENIISTLSEDESTKHLATIAEAVEEIVPELRGQNEFFGNLENFMRWTTNQQIEAQNDILDHLKGLLDTYRRPDLLGQIAAFFTMEEAIRQIKRLADSAEKIAGSLAGIEQNIESINLRGQYFPDDVYSYVRDMIESHSNKEVPHYFSVFNKGSLWRSKFADLQRANPLGPQYLGHKTDLDVLCAYLAEEVRPRVGPEAVLHILMPSIGPLAMVEAVKFPDVMRPFIVDGKRGNGGSAMVWLCTPEQEDKDCLRDIGVLQPREVWAMSGRVGIVLPFVGHWLSFPTKTQYFIDPTYKIKTDVYLGLVAGGYVYCRLEPARSLGRWASRPW
jgi:hypothetical protein